MDSKTTLAKFSNFTIINPILYTNKLVALSQAILINIGVILLKKLMSQQIYNIAPESRIQLLIKYFIDRAN